MKQTFTITMPPGFKAACLIFNLNPTELLQSFANSVLLYGKNYKPRRSVQCATSFVETIWLCNDEQHLANTPRQRRYISHMRGQHTKLMSRIAHLDREAQEKALIRYYERWVRGWEEIK